MTVPEGEHVHQGPAIYGRFASWYDALYEAVGKDYAEEASQLRAIIGAHVDAPRSLLDVACGTGGHLAHLAGDFEVAVGIDAAAPMLAIARDRLPDEVELHEADFRGFDLGRRFDVVMCLFSAIGHAGSREGVRAAMTAMAAHVDDGGVLMVEPWVTAGQWRDQHRDIDVARTDDGIVARVASSRREGDTAVVEFGWALADAGGAHVEHERHDLPLLTEDEYVDAISAAGLEALWQEGGLVGRGLVIGRREAA